MSVIGKSTNLAVKWLSKTGEYEGDGRAVLNPAVIINCRVENAPKRLLNDLGREVVSKARIFTEAQVCAGDFLVLDSARCEVISAAEILDIWGKYEHTEVRV